MSYDGIPLIISMDFSLAWVGTVFLKSFRLTLAVSVLVLIYLYGFDEAKTIAGLMVLGTNIYMMYILRHSSVLLFLSVIIFIVMGTREYSRLLGADRCAIEVDSNLLSQFLRIGGKRKL